MILKALKREAWFCEQDSDRITSEVGYHLRRVAEDVEQMRSEGAACTP